MAKTKQLNEVVKKYKKTGIVAVAVIVVALIGVWAISGFHKNIDAATATRDVTTTALTGADLRIAVISMDKIQADAKVLEDLHKQRANYESKLKSKLEK